MNGTDLIAIERKRQIEVEGFDAQHDNNEQDGTLEKAATAYILSSVGERKEGIKVWPWVLPYYKPRDPVRDLVRAGALIDAAIDRLQNKNNPTK